ncbi:Ubiquitin 3 binding protein But2 domain-containing protein [Cladophialophora immunda]|nr:Ubiquitin 3 binding protein But2 domain-containing protein [Cladophialophora immunda]
MKTAVIATAAFSSIAAAKGSWHYGGSSYPPYASKNCPFIPSADQFVLFADDIQTVSQVNPDKAFLRSQDLYVETADDLATASQFTIPDFAEGANCSLNLAVPSPDQIYGDLSQAIFSGGGNLNFSQLENDLPSTGLTFNTIGGLQNDGVMKLTPGQLLTVVPSFPCPPPGTVLPGIIQSVDTTLVVRDTVGPVCLSGLFVLIEPVGNPPSSPPPASTSAYETTSYAGSYTGTYTTYSAAATYSSKWSS